ncbi:MAG: tetratricopeptide repeat protein [Deltaproteobacteria bacterium]|nr:MAG: tetratricopeptide repeat protein [Deltaproteobacteria bacterium]
MALQGGTRIGPYQIVESLGAGGMGTVYRAHDPRLGRDVAVKVLSPECATDAGLVARFEQEARAAGVLNHPNILSVLDVGAQEQVHFLVSELLEGQTLRERLRAGPLPVAEMIEIAIQVLHGLAVAHEKGVVHRDLKPENLFLTREGTVKILDFGLAKLRGNTQFDSAATEPGTLVGSVGYMSPEQVNGLAADHRSDVFAIGAVLYEMLSGTRAFKGSSVVSVLNAILHDRPPELTSLDLDIPPQLSRVVDRCLERDPARRFQSARDLAFQIQALAAAPTPPSFSAEHRRSKGIRLPWMRVMAIAVLAALAGAGLFLRATGPSSASGPVSIAVLPLDNLTHDPAQDYFADGMTEALITDLARIRGLRVISRTSVMQFKGTTKPLPEVARILNVDKIVEGSVLRSGGRVRITAQLIDGESDRHLWSDSYDRDVSDVLALQGSVAQDISRQVIVALTPEERARFAHPRRMDPSVHELYLRGRYQWNKRTGDGLLKSVEYFKQVIERDPDYPLAHAALAQAYVLLGGPFVIMPPRQAYPAALSAARRALLLDDGLAEAHAALAFISMSYDWDWAAAEREFLRASELNPTEPTTLQWYAYALVALGRGGEAIAQFDRAAAVDPMSFVTSLDRCHLAYYARRYGEAIVQCRKALEMEPRHARAHRTLASVYLQAGDIDAAVKELATVRSMSDDPPTPFDVALEAAVLARAGHTAEARDLVHDLERSAGKPAGAIALAMAHAALEDADEAFRWLDQAFQQRFGLLVYLNVDPRWDHLRLDPRFKALVRRVGLPDRTAN